MWLYTCRTYPDIRREYVAVGKPFSWEHEPMTALSYSHYLPKRTECGQSTFPERCRTSVHSGQLPNTSSNICFILENRIQNVVRYCIRFRTVSENAVRYFNRLRISPVILCQVLHFWSWTISENVVRKSIRVKARCVIERSETRRIWSVAIFDRTHQILRVSDLLSVCNTPWFYTDRVSDNFFRNCSRPKMRKKKALHLAP